MESYNSIFHRAANRHGGEDVLNAKLDQDYPGLHFGQGTKSDDRWLAEFTLRTFQAGFNWSVVENKWEGFEAAFWGFDPQKCANIDMDDMERLTTNRAIVRNPVKIKAVPINARMILEMSEKAGSADRFIRDWPREDYVGLLAYLKKHGAHLGLNTASYALRMSGVDGFILTKDVIAALKHAGIVDKAPSSKRALTAVQEAFNYWAGHSGKSFKQISRTLGYSIDAG